MSCFDFYSDFLFLVLIYFIRMLAIFPFNPGRMHANEMNFDFYLIFSGKESRL
jgi:hypothetical protein